jgi:hypothetical protein
MKNHINQLVFCFERQREIELENTEYVLAGHLVIDIPKSAADDAKTKKVVNDIVLELSKMAGSGRMPEDALIFCWKDGKSRPDEITDDQEFVVLLQEWADDRLRVGVRTSKTVFGDSELMQAAGLMPRSGHA